MKVTRLSFPINIDQVNKAQSAHHAFARHFISGFHCVPVNPWRQFLFEMCQETLKRNPESYSEEKAATKNNHLPHVEFSDYLLEIVDRVAKGADRSEILRSYAIKKNRLAFPLVNEIVSYAGRGSVNEMANFVQSEYPEILKGRCFEIGAGTAPFLKNFRGLVGKNYFLSDLKLEYLRGETEASVLQYDMNNEIPLKDLDAVFATRTMHLAQDKPKTLGHIAESLKHGGHFIFAGAGRFIKEDFLHPHQFVNTFIPGFAEGGGFVSREDWCSMLDQVGLRPIHVVCLNHDDLEFSYFIVARK